MQGNSTLAATVVAIALGAIMLPADRVPVAERTSVADDGGVRESLGPDESDIEALSSTGDIVEVLPAANRDPALRAAAQRSPSPMPAWQALQLAERQMHVLRLSGDASQGGRALQLLNHPVLQADPQAMLLRADLLQHLHRFDEAATLLGSLERSLPESRAMWLLNANLARVQGRIADARRACTKAAALARDAWSEVCLTDLAMLSDDAGAWRRLQSWLAVSGNAAESRDVLLSVWLGDLADRAGDAQAAERYFQRALLLGGSSFAVHRHANFLLRQARPADALRLLDWWQLRSTALPDALVLDQAIAAQRAGDAQRALSLRITAQKSVFDNDREGIAVAAIDRDEAPRHWREMARYTLAFGSDTGLALQYALANWRVQKEPIDAWLLDRAASEAQAPEVRLQLRDELARRDMAGVATQLDSLAASA